MKIIETSRSLSVKEKFVMTMGNDMKKMSDHVGEVLDISAWCLYEDSNEDGKEMQILSIMTPEKEVLATNSATFQRDFRRMVELFADGGEELTQIAITGGTSKSGREFITCTVVLDD